MVVLSVLQKWPGHKMGGSSEGMAIKGRVRSILGMTTPFIIEKLTALAPPFKISISATVQFHI